MVAYESRLELARKFRHHSWLDSALEPLTARALVAVEGISDRVLLHALARAVGLDLDQAGISVVVVNGATNFGSPLKLFGTAGFDIAILTVVDEAEAAIVAGVLGCAVADYGGQAGPGSRPTPSVARPAAGTGRTPASPASHSCPSACGAATWPCHRLMPADCRCRFLRYSRPRGCSTPRRAEPG
jgi:hypothetical protein